jgi:hypothetical protein
MTEALEAFAIAALTSANVELVVRPEGEFSA